MWWISAAALAAPVDRIVEVADQVTVTVSVQCGSVRITGSERRTVHLSGTVPEGGALDVSGSSGRVEVEFDPSTPDTCVSLVLEVPAGADLDLESLAASFTIDGVRGGVQAETLSGTVAITGLPRSVRVESVSGALTVSGGAQRLELESVSGAVSAAGVGGVASLSSVSGPVSLAGGSPFTEAELESVSGTLAFSGVLDASGSLEASTHGGAMRIRLPSDLDARLSQSTFSGKIRDAFGQEEDLVVGAGRARIELSTFSGDIDVDRE